MPADGLALDEAMAYLADVRWKYAKTMPDWPHEYTVKSWRPELADRFEAFCRLIRETGFVEPWPPPPATARYAKLLPRDRQPHVLGHGPTRRPRPDRGQDRHQPSTGLELSV